MLYNLLGVRADGSLRVKHFKIFIHVDTRNNHFLEKEHYNLHLLVNRIHPNKKHRIDRVQTVEKNDDWDVADECVAHNYY
jgi:hypothetical protein